MSTLKKLFFVLLSVAGWGSATAQDLSNKGNEFWVGYGHHQFMEPGQSNSQEMVLYFSAEQNANVTVTINGTGYVQNYYVPAGQVIASQYMPKNGTNDCRLYSVPPSFGGTGGEGVFDRGIHIVSDVPIVAYAHTFGSASSGATMLMPTETWGYSYISINSKQRYANNCFSWAYVVADHDNTVVEITPSVLTRNGRTPGVPFTVNLNKGQIYQIIGANPSNGADALEVSGTRFKSIANAAGECYPVAVFSGSSRTTNPISCGSGGGDNDNQQLFPTQAWGKRYLTSPTSRSTSANQFMTNSYKVLVKDPTTVVTRNGVPLTGLQAGAYYYFESSTADEILADKPIMVAQFMTGGSGCMGGGVGDPEMIYISPIEQGIKRIGFYRNNRENIQVNYLTMIVPTPAVSSIRIDGSPAFDYSYAHPRAAGHTVVIKRWSSAQAQCIVTCDSAFTAITYGLGSVESYGYNAGTRINNLSALSFIHNTYDSTAQENEFTCINTPVELSVLMAYQPTRIDWQLSLLGPVITPNADVVDNAPVLVGTVLVNGVTYYKYNLPGTYSFSVADTILIPIRGYHPSIENCNNRENLKVAVIVKPEPVADFSFTHTGCTLDTVYFSSDTTTSNNYTIGQYNWTFPGPSTASGQYQNVLLPPGTHTIGLQAISTEGCVDDTTKTITIFDKPPADFEITPVMVCEGAAFTITDTSSVNSSLSVNEWYWDFGNGDVQTITTGASLSYTYPAYGNYAIRHVSKSSATCISDTLTRNVIVYAKPAVDFSYPLGCLDVSGTAQFTGTATTPDGQAFTTYSWDFGDGSTGAVQNPVHNYAAGGNYSVSFSAVTANGCTEDTTKVITLNLTPLLNYGAQAALPVCENMAPLSVANASVTNGVTGTGVYKGPGMSADGTFDPAQAGPGDHLIWYVFTSTGGCADSVSQLIHVSARPKVDFSIPANGCLPVNGLVQFTDATTITDAQTFTSYTWDFGDGGSATLQNPVHNYTEGTYAIKLTVTSSDGCSGDTTITKTLALMPQLAYPVLNSVCEDIQTVSVATATVTNGVTGSGIYRGPGTAGNGDFAPGTAGAGTHTIWYVFTSGGGCADSVSQTITVLPKPVSQFTVTPDICQDQSASIADNSSVAGGAIVAWNWDFGNGTTASNANNNPFTVSYTTFNSYIIKLRTVSDNGCVSDEFTQTVAVHALPAADFALPASVCLPGGSADFTNQSTIGDNASMSYTWDFGDGYTDISVNPSHVYAAAGTYNVTLNVLSVYGCTGTVTKPLSSFFTKPVAQFAVSPDTLCQGSDNVFSDQSTDATSAITNWSWNFADGTSSTLQSPVKKYNAPGNYAVSLSVTNAAGCVSDPFVKPVIVYLQPVIDAGPSFVVPQGTVIQFNPTVNDSTISFLWTPGYDFPDPTILRPVLVANYDQTYTLTATGLGNCSASDMLTVNILKPVLVPNAFSPNGDGVNDRWEITNLSDYPGALVEVYNRYGQLIYKSTGYPSPWDGNYNGKPVPVATYYYVITLKNGFKPLTGSLTIVR